MDNLTLIEAASTQTIAETLIAALRDALAKTQGDIAISVPGGSTPFPILEVARDADLDWSRIAVWPGDDRIVPEDHEASNTGKIRALLEPVGAQIVALEEGAKPPHFALVWLGMGEDGHIASLFPNTDPKVDDPLALRRLTPDPLPPHAPFDRITLTIPALLNSDALMFVIRGDDKRQVFDGALEGAHDLPIARLLGAAHQPVTCFT
jgi:6-phosphogluconolactonase